MAKYPSMNDMTTDEAFYTLQELVPISEEALGLVIAINGYKRETFAEILYAKTGYRDFDQMPVTYKIYVCVNGDVRKHALVIEIPDEQSYNDWVEDMPNDIIHQTETAVWVDGGDE